ncbi:hypothetical protein [Bacillus wiedmannii]|uniref:hypothetical protein n=1 Tax=Bacillus wiedmannii TaxID=1890302 RepID=UPI0015CF2B1E|nr:hypothetical protein [Bacillus wiedmannii]
MRVLLAIFFVATIASFVFMSKASKKYQSKGKYLISGIVCFMLTIVFYYLSPKEEVKDKETKTATVEVKKEDTSKHVEKEDQKQGNVSEEKHNDRDQDKNQLKEESKKEIKTQDETKVKKATIDEYKGRINQAFKEMGRKTNLKINSTDVLEDGRTVINLSDNILIFLTTDKDQYIEKATLGMTTDAYLLERKDFEFAFLLLIGTIDDSLNYSERYLVKQELGLSDKEAFNKQFTKTYKRNGIIYTFKGGIKDNFILQAELKN